MVEQGFITSQLRTSHDNSHAGEGFNWQQPLDLLEDLMSPLISTTMRACGFLLRLVKQTPDRLGVLRTLNHRSGLLSSTLFVGPLCPVVGNSHCGIKQAIYVGLAQLDENLNGFLPGNLLSPSADRLDRAFLTRAPL